ncbi:unnamed protein product, partial [Trichogramma brassicae]
VCSSADYAADKKDMSAMSAKMIIYILERTLIRYQRGVPGVICIDEKRTKKGSVSEHQCVSRTQTTMSCRREEKDYEAEKVNFFFKNRQNNIFQCPIWKYFHQLKERKKEKFKLCANRSTFHCNGYGTIRICIDRNLHFQLKVCWSYAISCRLLRHVNFAHALQDERRNVTHAPPRASMRGIGCHPHAMRKLFWPTRQRAKFCTLRSFYLRRCTSCQRFLSPEFIQVVAGITKVDDKNAAIYKVEEIIKHEYYGDNPCERCTAPPNCHTHFFCGLGVASAWVLQIITSFTYLAVLKIGSAPKDLNQKEDPLVTEVSWELKWSQEKEAEVHGPHTSEQMHTWSKEGYFKNGAWAPKKCAKMANNMCALKNVKGELETQRTKQTIRDVSCVVLSRQRKMLGGKNQRRALYGIVHVCAMAAALRVDTAKHGPCSRKTALSNTYSDEQFVFAHT